MSKKAEEVEPNVFRHEVAPGVKHVYAKTKLGQTYILYLREGCECDLIATGDGDIEVEGPGKGSAIHNGDGDATRRGPGDGNAEVHSTYIGHASRSGDGSGWAIAGSRMGHANKSGTGMGGARRMSNGVGFAECSTPGGYAIYDDKNLKDAVYKLGRDWHKAVKYLGESQ